METPFRGYLRRYAAARYSVRTHVDTLTVLYLDCPVHVVGFFTCLDAIKRAVQTV